jgi:3-keto-5-aminohexanoate cleavage enzyme
VEREAVVVEVGLNEATLRSQNPHVPYSPAECAADGRRGAEAGAAIVHWHARDPETGAQRLADATLYGDALVAMRPSGVLAYPSYPIDVEDIDARLGHCWALRQRHGLELAPVDVGSVSAVVWDEASHDFPFADALPAGGVVANPLGFVLAALEQVDALEMVPTLGVFDVGGTRTVALLADAGRLRAPILLKIFLSGAFAVGPFPTEDALDFHLRQLPEGLDVEWLAVPYAVGDPAVVERLCRHALARGGGIRVGIGDNPAAYPDATNAALVEQAVRWAGESGRPVASPDDVRRRLGIP